MVLDSFGEGVWYILHDQIEEGALLFLHEEGMMQANNILILNLLQDFQFSIFVLLILKDVFHGVKLLSVSIPHLPISLLTRYTFPKVPQPMTSIT